MCNPHTHHTHMILVGQQSPFSKKKEKKKKTFAEVINGQTVFTILRHHSIKSAVVSAWRPDRLKRQVPSFRLKKQVQTWQPLPAVDEKFLANTAKEFLLRNQIERKKRKVRKKNVGTPRFSPRRINTDRTSFVIRGPPHSDKYCTVTFWAVQRSC